MFWMLWLLLKKDNVPWHSWRKTSHENIVSSSWSRRLEPLVERVTKVKSFRLSLVSCLRPTCAKSGLNGCGNCSIPITIFPRPSLKGMCNDFSSCHIPVVSSCLDNTLLSSRFFPFQNCLKCDFGALFWTAPNSFPGWNGEKSSMRAANKTWQKRDALGRTR